MTSVVIDDKHGRDQSMLIYWQGLAGQKASVGCVKFKSKPVPTEKIARKINYISSIGVNCSAKVKKSRKTYRQLSGYYSLHKFQLIPSHPSHSHSYNTKNAKEIKSNATH